MQADYALVIKRRQTYSSSTAWLLAGVQISVQKEETMKIIRILCHNAVVIAEAGEEFVVVGRGIGFHKHPGEIINPQTIEARYQKIE